MGGGCVEGGTRPHTSLRIAHCWRQTAAKLDGSATAEAYLDLLSADQDGHYAFAVR
jgi:hypothetical protein